MEYHGSHAQKRQRNKRRPVIQVERRPCDRQLPLPVQEYEQAERDRREQERALMEEDHAAEQDLREMELPELFALPLGWPR